MNYEYCVTDHKRHDCTVQKVVRCAWLLAAPFIYKGEVLWDNENDGYGKFHQAT